MKSKLEIARESAGLLRTVEPFEPGPSMYDFFYWCETPSCAAGYLRHFETNESYMEARIEELLHLADEEDSLLWGVVFESTQESRTECINKLGLDLAPGADKGRQSLLEAADRIEYLAEHLGWD